MLPPIKTLHIFDTEYSADSIEWCPIDGYKAYFVCGTYQLLQNDDAATNKPLNDETADIGQATNAASQCERTGRILLFRYDRANDGLFELQRLNCAAILDMRWQPAMATATTTRKRAILAAATALGKVELYELINGDDADDGVDQQLQLQWKYSLAVNANELNLLTLSLDWQLDGRRLLCSDSKGGLSLFAVKVNDNDVGGGDVAMEALYSWPEAHSFEAWICAFDKWNEHHVYSGGDDCLLRAYDLRTNARTLTNKTHNAGVTCLLSHPTREHLLLTGSYDEHVRAFDARSMRQPLAELNLGGGVWRLKAHPCNNSLILAACMYKNFSVVHLRSQPTADVDNDAMHLVGEYNEHASICYGADWCATVKLDDATSEFATCSFYDHKLCVASFQH